MEIKSNFTPSWALLINLCVQFTALKYLQVTLCLSAVRIDNHLCVKNSEMNSIAAKPVHFSK